MAARLHVSLADYLASVAGRRWQIGALDCCLFAADWVVIRRGVDPMQGLRGAYRTVAQARKLLQARGGVVLAVADAMAAIGARPVEDPAAGDIVIVRAPYAVRRGQLQRREVCGIAVTDRLSAVITSDLGVVIADRDRLPLVTTWGFGGG